MSLHRGIDGNYVLSKWKINIKMVHIYRVYDVEFCLFVCLPNAAISWLNHITGTEIYIPHSFLVDTLFNGGGEAGADSNVSKTGVSVMLGPSRRVAVRVSVHSSNSFMRS